MFQRPDVVDGVILSKSEHRSGVGTSPTLRVKPFSQSRPKRPLTKAVFCNLLEITNLANAMVNTGIGKRGKMFVLATRNAYSENGIRNGSLLLRGCAMLGALLATSFSWCRRFAAAITEAIANSLVMPVFCHWLIPVQATMRLQGGAKP